MPWAIEPGLLAVFRLFVALEILLLLFRIGLEATFRADFPLVGWPWAGLSFLIVLLGYLSWPRLSTRLGRLYLPLALGASAGVTLVSAAQALYLRVATGIRAEELVRGSWLTIVLLTVPLVLVAWQYGVRHVLWFCLLTTAADLVLTVPIAGGGGPPLLTLIVIAVVRCLFFLPVGYVLARLMDAQRRQRAALADATARLAHHASALEQLAVSRERNRLAYELHDTLAHGLSSLAVQLEAINAIWPSQPARAHAMLAETLATARTALREARRAIRALRASPLDDLGLAGAVRELARSTAANAGLAVAVHVTDVPPGLGADAEQTVYRVAAEALTNVVRHAHARHLTVTLEPLGGEVRLVVADDGRGFDPARVSADAHFGIFGMQERARMIGAALAVESAPGSGTVVRLAVRRTDDSRSDL